MGMDAVGRLHASGCFEYWLADSVRADHLSNNLHDTQALATTVQLRGLRLLTSAGSWLTLTTYWPKSGSEKRMYVRAKLVEVSP